MDFPDVNVWLAMTVTGHEHHKRAMSYRLDEADGRFAFSTITGLGFMRLISSPQVMGEDALSVADSWRKYAGILARPDVELVNDPLESRTILEQWALEAVFPWRLWTDAYLAAFAVAGNLRLVTFDRDFRRFKGLDLLRLAP